jgi:G3E family GTPase
MASVSASIYRVKGIVYYADDPGRRHVLQLVGKRITITADREWGASEPGTLLVFIGAQGAFDTTRLNTILNACAIA